MAHFKWKGIMCTPEALPENSRGLTTTKVFDSLSNTTGTYQWSRLPEIYSSGLEPWCWSLLHSLCHAVIVCYPILFRHRYLHHDTTLNLSVCPLKEWLVKSIKYQDCQSLLLSQHPADFPDYQAKHGHLSCCNTYEERSNKNTSMWFYSRFKL